MMGSFSIVVATNDEAVLGQNLLASPMIAQGAVPVHLERGAASAAIAYNRGLDAATAPVVVFAHQDVYFPAGWDRLLEDAIARMAALDPDWALLAAFGITPGGREIGPVWSSSIGRVVGAPTDAPVPAQSIDELVIVLRRASGLRFDEGLPGYHLYGTDILLTARERGLGAYACSLPLVHNDGFHDRLGADFRAAYRYMQRKWRHRLPVQTPVTTITRLGLPLAVKMLRMWRSRGKRRALAVRTTADPASLAAACGWGQGGAAGPR